MSIPLSQLMQGDDPDVGPPHATFQICLSAKLAEELIEATERYTDLEARFEKAVEEAENPDRPDRPRRVGQRTPLRELEREAEEAAAAADAIRDRMAARSIDLRIVVNEDLWKAFTRDHPAREASEDPTGARRDRIYGAMFCDVDALQDVADQFITRYGDERPTAESWAFVKANSAPGERDMLAAKIVQMHTQGVDLGKSRTALRSSRRRATGSE